MCLCVHTHHGTHVEDAGQLLRVGSFLTPWVLGIKLRSQARQQVLSPTEPFYYSLIKQLFVLLNF